MGIFKVVIVVVALAVSTARGVVPMTIALAASAVAGQDGCAGINEDDLNDDDITIREPAWRAVEEGYRKEIEEWRASEDMSVDELNNKPCHRIIDKYWDHPDPELRGRARDAWRGGEYGPPEIIPDSGTPGYRSFVIEPWMLEEKCDDGKDNDGDGRTDLLDADCKLKEHRADVDRSGNDRGGSGQGWKRP